MCLRTGLRGSTKMHQTILLLIALGIITFSVLSATDSYFTLCVLQQQPLLPCEWQIWKLFLNGAFYTFSCQAWIPYLSRKCPLYLFESWYLQMESVCVCLIGRVADKHSSVGDTEFTVMFDELATLHYENSTDWWLLAGTWWLNPPHLGPLSFLIRLCCQARINTFFSFSSGWL